MILCELLYDSLRQEFFVILRPKKLLKSNRLLPARSSLPNYVSVYRLVVLKIEEEEEDVKKRFRHHSTVYWETNGRGWWDVYQEDLAASPARSTPARATRNETVSNQPRLLFLSVSIFRSRISFFPISCFSLSAAVTAAIETLRKIQDFSELFLNIGAGHSFSFNCCGDGKTN